jgi:hypothetical protein
MEIGLIGEGVTDQVTIEHILIGYFEDKNLKVNPLQPLPGEPGNWDKVFKYCQSDELKQALLFNDFIVIQVDTDFFRRGEVPENLKLNIAGLGVEEITILVKAKLIEFIGIDFYEENRNAFVFAIAVDETECWFLPIYFHNQPVKAAKTTNCLETLNQVLFEKEHFYINKKEPHYYRTMGRHFHKKKDLFKFSSKNESLGIFVRELETKTNSLQH